MVANDQAYDSHAANGLLLNNNTGLYFKDAGGDNRECVNLDGSDVLNIGDGANMEVGLKIMAKASIYLSANQENLVDNTWTKVLLNAENYDVGADFAANKFVAPITGYYLHVGQAVFVNTISNKEYDIAFYKNDVLESVSAIRNTTTDPVYVAHSSRVIPLTATQYTELYARVIGTGVNTIDIYGGAAYTFMDIHLLSI